MRDPGVSRRRLIFLSHPEARRCSLWGTFCNLVEAQLCPACPRGKRLLAPGGARPAGRLCCGWTVEVGCGGRSDTPSPQLPGVGQGLRAHHLSWIPRRGRWAAAGMRGRALLPPGPTRSFAGLVWFDPPGRLTPNTQL